MWFPLTRAGNVVSAAPQFLLYWTAATRNPVEALKYE